MLVNMEMTIVNERDNPFFKRKEMIIEVKHPNAATPSKADVIKEIAGKNSVDESQVVVDYILTKKGIPQTIAKLKVLTEKPKVEPKSEAKQGENVEAQANQAT